MVVELQWCSDGVVIPADQLCPPPYSGPYSYYSDSENINIPYPPAPDGSNGTNTTTTSSNYQGSPSSISTGALAGIILVILAFFLALICAFAIKFGMRLPIIRLPLFRPRSSLQRQQSDMNGDDQELNGNDVVVDVMNATYSRGLEEKLLSLLPVSVYVPNHHGNNTEGKVPYMTECAVCLNLFEEKDIVRVLPTCSHTFHICCIDRWFESHANCPLCRETITLQSLIQLSDTTEMTDPHQQGLGENPHDLNYNPQGRDRHENNNDANPSAEGEMCQNGEHNSPDMCQNGDHHSANTGMACHDNIEPEQADHAPEVLGISSCEKGALVS